MPTVLKGLRVQTGVGGSDEMMLWQEWLASEKEARHRQGIPPNPTSTGISSTRSKKKQPVSKYGHKFLVGLNAG